MFLEVVLPGYFWLYRRNEVVAEREVGKSMREKGSSVLGWEGRNCRLQNPGPEFRVNYC